MKAHPHLPYVDTRRITRILKVPPVEILGALALLEKVGELRHAYKVIAPTNHVLTDGIYHTVEEIPEVLRDTSETQFSREEGGILPVYERLESGGSDDCAGA
jgi:hypothetical protein